MQHDTDTIVVMAKKKTVPKADDRHKTPRVAFHLPDEYLEILDALRKPAKRTLTAQILMALEEHFDHNQEELAGKWPLPTPD